MAKQSKKYCQILAAVLFSRMTLNRVLRIFVSIQYMYAWLPICARSRQHGCLQIQKKNWRHGCLQIQKQY